MSSADFDPQLKVGTVLTNQELVAIFKCSPQSGMRRSLRTNSLVLTTSRDGMYLDRWENDLLHYTGMGLHGDQDLHWMRNRSPNGHRRVHELEATSDIVALKKRAGRP